MAGDGCERHCVASAGVLFEPRHSHLNSPAKPVSELRTRKRSSSYSSPTDKQIVESLSVAALHLALTMVPKLKWTAGVADVHYWPWLCENAKDRNTARIAFFSSFSKLNALASLTANT